MAIEYISRSPEETRMIGKQIFAEALANDIIALTGDLGAGKTTLIKGMFEDNQDIVASPTFTYLNIYPRNPPVYHFDLYRISCATHFLSMGFEEYFEKEGICLIEWAENIWDLLPAKASFIKITHLDESSRKIIYEKN